MKKIQKELRYKKDKRDRRKAMKKTLFLITLLLISALGVFAITFDEANKQSKPIVVMFHMHGCSACKQFMPLFDKISEKHSDNFVFVKEDIDNSSLAKSLNFKFVPAVFIIEPKTMEAQRIEDDCAWDQGCFEKRLKKYKK